jgi:hypothetical protein
MPICHICIRQAFVPEAIAKIKYIYKKHKIGLFPIHIQVLIMPSLARRLPWFPVRQVYRLEFRWVRGK